jgi:hypothetical protein
MASVDATVVADQDDVDPTSKMVKRNVTEPAESDEGGLTLSQPEVIYKS